MTGFGRFMWVTSWIGAFLLIVLVAFNWWQGDGWGVFGNCVVLALTLANLKLITVFYGKEQP